MGSVARNESNSHQDAGISEKKVFHETDVHNVYKVGIKRFCAQEAEMSLEPTARSNGREENSS